MPISAGVHALYGGNLVTQKYKPLANVLYAGGQRNVYSAMLANRRTVLNQANLLPRTLRLAVPNWAAAIAREAAPRNPPLVVISSNRSAWIAAGVVAGNNQLQALGVADFPDASDLSALQDFSQDGQSPPLYHRGRVGVRRSVYVVVHINEYRTYLNAFAGTNLNVVGWVFDSATPMPQDARLTGFGASRFAAIEFCKELRRGVMAAAPGGAASWNYAWLIDDNVVAMNNFAGFAAVETALGAAPGAFAAGFHGGTRSYTAAENVQWANGLIGAGNGGQAGALPASAPPGLIQQAACWNIAQLTATNRNFGPVFIASGEDVSIGKYFDRNAIPYLYYNGIGVRKEDATSDNGAPAQKLNTYRRNLARWITTAESAGVAGALPPPVTLQLRNLQGAPTETMATFITQRVIPGSQLAPQAGDANVENTGKLQGVEQIICEALDNNFINQQPQTDAFQLNGAGTAHPIGRLNLP
jgi:hypothetical protein